MCTLLLTMSKQSLPNLNTKDVNGILIDMSFISQREFNINKTTCMYLRHIIRLHAQSSSIDISTLNDLIYNVKSLMNRLYSRGERTQTPALVYTKRVDPYSKYY